MNLNGLSPANVAEASALGAHWVRVFVPWPDLEPAQGVHSAFWLGQYDRLLGALPKGTHAILDFVDTPSWESGSAAPNTPPSNPADYANILHFIAQRWAGKVAAYEIWNEEDATLWWAGAPDPAAYTRLLQAAYPAVKSADPAAKVVLGGFDGQRLRLPRGRVQGRREGLLRRDRRAHRHRLRHQLAVHVPARQRRADQRRLVHRLPRSPRDRDRQRRRRADLDDRDELAHNLRGVRRRRVRRAEARGRERSPAGEVPDRGLPLPRAGAVCEARPVVPDRRRRRGRLRPGAREPLAQALLRGDA